MRAQASSATSAATERCRNSDAAPTSVPLVETAQKTTSPVAPTALAAAIALTSGTGWAQSDAPPCAQRRSSPSTPRCAKRCRPKRSACAAGCGRATRCWRSVQQLESTLAAADLVICQAGCVSHDAYGRVKDHCKRTGKRCMFVRKPSAHGLRTALLAACESENA